jgi:Tfp pilus assembly protein PilN
MINLLPEQNKKNIQAGRTNLLLVRYNILMLGALMFAFASLGVLYIYLANTKAAAEQTITDNKAKVSEYNTVESQAADFRAHLATAKQIMDQEIVYTKIVLQVARLIPHGVVIDNLALDPKTFGAATVMTAHCKTVDDATALKESFQNTTLFSNVYFASLSNNEGDTTGYPITVTLNVTMNKAGIE